jgi:hypothetical protein
VAFGILLGCDLLESPTPRDARASSIALLEMAQRSAAVADSAKAYSDSLLAVRKADSVRTLTARSTWRSDSGKSAKTKAALAIQRAKDSVSIIKTRTADSLAKARHYTTDSGRYAKDSIAGAKTLAAVTKKFATKMAKDTAAYNKAQAAGAARVTKDSIALVAAQTTKYATKLAKDSAAVDAAQALVDAETDSTSAKVKTSNAAKLTKAKAALQKTLDAQTKAIASARAKLSKDSAANQAKLATLAAKMAANPTSAAAQYTKDSTAIAAKLAKDLAKWTTRGIDDSTKLATDVEKKTAKWAKDTADMAAAEVLAKAKKTADSIAIVSADSLLVLSRGLVSFSPAAGTFSVSTPVTLTSTYTSGINGKIYYTTDGSTPTTSSSLYSGAITVDAGMTIKAIATQTGYSSTAVVGARYYVGTTASPTFLPAAGTYSGTQSVVVTTADSATIYYTLNGATPTTASASVTDYGGTILVDSIQTLKVLAVRNGKAPAAVASAAYSIRVDAPTMSPETDSTAYDSMIVVLSTDDTLSVIHYTMDGSTPTSGSATMASGGSIKLKSTRTVKAICTRNHFANSDVVTTNDTIQVSPVEFSVAAGDIDTSAPILDTLTTTTPNAKIYYTIDGSEPTVASTLYTTAIALTDAVTVRAIAVKPNLKNSAESTAEYTVAQPPPE